MENAWLPVILSFGLLAVSLWLYAYCYGLYWLGRWVALRYRLRSNLAFTGVALGSAILSLPFYFLNVDIVWKCTIVYAVFITHVLGVGSGVWGGIEIGKLKDDQLFRERTNDWLKEWEEPVPKRLKSDDE